MSIITKIITHDSSILFHQLFNLFCYDWGRPIYRLFQLCHCPSITLILFFVSAYYFHEDIFQITTT